MPPWRSTGTDGEAESPQYAGEYVLEAELGSGGMGVVHLARSASGLKLAVKVVHAAFAQDPEFRGRFRQEIGAARKVSGAFTAPVVDADPEAGRPWMATLFIPGPTLAEHVKRNGALPVPRLRQLMAGLAEALRDIHRAGVVHRDLKPSNVLLAEDGPKVIDFGISRPSDSELRTETGKLIGTPPFMAPEQFRRPRTVGPAADVFALGSVIVHAATGSGPFDSDSPYLVAYQVVHEEPDLTGVPDDLAPLVARCLAKEPDERPTPDELMAELRTVSASYDTQAFIPDQRGPATDDGAVGSPIGSPVGSAIGSAVSSVVGSVGGASEAPTHRRRVPAVVSGPASDGVRRPSRRRRLWMGIGAGIVVLALGGGVMALGGEEPDATPAGRERPVGERPVGERPVGERFRAWEAEVSAEGVRASGVARCVYSPAALYCSRPGLLAAAVDPEDGTVRWARAGAAEGGPKGGDGTVEPPVLAGGLLHVLADDGRRLTALDPGTGRTRWSHDLTGYGGRFAHAGGVVLLTAADSTVTALDAATGERKWRHRVEGLAQPTFRSYGDGTAYAVGLDGIRGTRVVAVDPESGATRWERRLGGALTLVGARDGVLWFTSTSASFADTDAVVRYDVEGRTKKRIALRHPVAGAQTVVADETVYLLGAQGALVAVDTRRAEQVWRLETSVSFPSAPVVADGRLYFSAGDGRLIAVGAARGEPLGQTEARPGAARDSVVSGLPVPVAADGKVFGATPDGVLFGVDGAKPGSW
ncbi:serine/threonine-protein kinase [Streptomyces sp. NPDC088789]|uniref:serine/threonine-protein kinase n=1 Tax=Streptomyces sp. NPDC088789 TaxID=3365899 RepID=UPI003820C9FE